jgi:putative FmdB family regulatory protein
MPIYEYKCPNGHLFEVFHGMTEAGPAVCEVCGEGPLQVVLHPVAVHYKGSGFYSTDYGRKGKKPVKEGASESTTSSSSSGESSSSGSSGSSGSSDSSSSGGDTKKSSEG